MIIKFQYMALIFSAFLNVSWYMSQCTVFKHHFGILFGMYVVYDLVYKNDPKNSCD